MTDEEIFNREMRQPLIETLTAGNHLANVLIQRLGTINFPHRLPSPHRPLDPNDERTQLLLKGDTWDIWIAWRAIMRLRAAMENIGLVER